MSFLRCSQFHTYDVVPMSPGGAALRVKDFEPVKWILWWDKTGDVTWLWHIEEIALGRSRLLTRVRIQYRWTQPGVLFNLLLIEPWDFPMMRKCMLGHQAPGQVPRDRGASGRHQTAHLTS